MIKRIIFDIDDTLIMWKDEYSLKLKEELEKYNLGIDYTVVDNIFTMQEQWHDKMSTDYIKEDIKKETNIEVTDEFLEDALKAQYTLAEDDKELVNVISYLSTKYDLIVVTNWFKDVQVHRLETAGILKYFSEVIGGDIMLKPDTLKGANGDYKYEECLVVGDSDRFDMEPAKKLGMKTYKINEIEDLYKLKEML